MPLPKDINEYLRAWAPELGERILQTYPPLQGFDYVASPLTGQLLRKPFPAQTLAMMGVVKRWTEAQGAAVIAECGTGKTLISLGAVHVHSDRKAIHGPRHGSAPVGREMGARSISDSAARARFLHRRSPNARQFRWSRGDKRS